MDESLIGAMFLDLRRALETVDHTSLQAKVKWFNPYDNMYRWLFSYLTQRNQVFTSNEDLSKKSTISTGVPKGSILELLLFLIYEKDLRANLPAEVIILQMIPQCHHTV